MFWDFNLNTVVLIVVLLTQCYKVYLHNQIRGTIEKQDKAVRENLGVVANFSAVVMQYVKGFHTLTACEAKDAKNARETMTTLAEQVKQEVVSAASNAAVVVAAKEEKDASSDSNHQVEMAEIAADVKDVKSDVKDVKGTVKEVRDLTVKVIRDHDQK